MSRVAGQSLGPRMPIPVVGKHTLANTKPIDQKLREKNFKPGDSYTFNIGALKCESYIDHGDHINITFTSGAGTYEIYKDSVGGLYKFGKQNDPKTDDIHVSTFIDTEVKTGGRPQKYKFNNRLYTIRRGPRNGEFIKVANRKHYI